MGTQTRPHCGHRHQAKVIRNSLGVPCAPNETNARWEGRYASGHCSPADLTTLADYPYKTEAVAPNPGL